MGRALTAPSLTLAAVVAQDASVALGDECDMKEIPKRGKKK